MYNLLSTSKSLFDVLSGGDSISKAATGTFNKSEHVFEMKVNTVNNKLKAFDPAA